MKFDFSGWSVSEIKARLVSLRKERAALESEELALVAALDREEAHLMTGATSTAAMLAGEAQMSASAARKMVETANALSELPLLSEAQASGELSSEVVGQVASFATRETEAELVKVAQNWSAAEAWREARRRKAITREEEAEAAGSREVRFSKNRAGTAVDLYARLTAEGGARLQAAIERTARALPKEVAGKKVSFPARMADALVGLAAEQISRDSAPDRATVSLHVDYETLVGSGNGELGSGYVSAEIARRIACDSRLELVLDDPNGYCLGVGRTSRSVPEKLARQIRYRDKACMYPGCERAFGLEIHHIVHWADGGPTDYINLVLLCFDHHGLVHEGGWKLTGTVRDGLVFAGDWGQRVTVAPFRERRLKLGRARAPDDGDRQQELVAAEVAS